MGGALLTDLYELTMLQAHVDCGMHRLAALPAPLRELETAAAYPVVVSPGLQALGRRVDERQRALPEASDAR